MQLDNFLVRPHRRAVEQFSQAEAWTALSPEDQDELENNVAGLPSALREQGLYAKQFDLLLLRMQLTLLRGEAGFNTMREKVEAIARALETKSAIPAVAAKLPLIQEIQSPLFWEDVSVICFETVRKGFRDLVQFIDRVHRKIVEVDFVDTMGMASTVDLLNLTVGVDPERIRDKILAFLRKHENDPVLIKLRFNEPLNATDLAALEAIFVAEGSTPEEISFAKETSQGLGLFVRSLIGLDRGAAKAALASFMNGKPLTANRIEFTNLLINHLAQRGWIDPGQLFSSPFTDLHPHGIDGLFDDTSTVTLLSALKAVRGNAAALTISRT